MKKTFFRYVVPSMISFFFGGLYSIVDAFFGATFVGGRHQNRLNLIAEQEAEYCKPEKL